VYTARPFELVSTSRSQIHDALVGGYND